MFLMYRVELKGALASFLLAAESRVPNVPCGVESPSVVSYRRPQPHVPNVPCGVERKSSPTTSCKTSLVPNVPCGVERGDALEVLKKMPPGS